MHIRGAKTEDIPHIVKLSCGLLNIHNLLDPDYYQLEDHFDELFSGWVKEQLYHPNQFILVAVDNSSDKIIGFISGFLKSLYPWFRTKTVGHIAYLVIDPGFRRRGVGKKLEEEAIHWFKSKNIDYIEVYVDEKNIVGTNAWSTYKYLPFKKFLRKKV